MPLDPLILEDNLELDRRAYELRRSGNPVKLSRIPMELLLLLGERRGELVTRDEIGERIWGKGVFVDRDNNINAALRKLRQVLHDDPDHPKFVQTVTGRGYRFIAPAMDPADLTSVSVECDPLPAPLDFALGGTLPHPTPPIHLRRLWLILPAVTILLVVAAGVYLQCFRSRTHPQPAPGRLMLAVLPFQNLTGDASQDYFSDGMTEEMIAQLGHSNPQQLGVIARTSVMHYQGSTEPLDQIARELGVQYVLEGSVRRDADQVRITAQLIRMTDQTHILSRQYDRELHSVLAVQGEIAQEISDEIQSALGERAASTS